MPGPKTNELPRRAGAGGHQQSRAGAGGQDQGTRAVLRHVRVAPNKVREILNLVRDRPVHEALDILRFSERDAAFLVSKVLRSAVANAEHNDSAEPEELYVSACFADEGTTIKRWRPRARGRATRIRKRTSHITIIVSRLPEDRLERLQRHRRSEQLAARARRVAGARRSSGSEGPSRAERRRRRGPPVEDVGTGDVETEHLESEPVEEPETEAGSTAAGEVQQAEEDAGIVDPTAEGVAAGEAAGESGGESGDTTPGEPAKDDK